MMKCSPHTGTKLLTMLKSELLSINPTIDVDKGLIIRITFANIARWAPKVLKTYTMSVEDFLEFMETCFKHFGKESEIPASKLFSLEVQESQIKLIANNEVYFPMPIIKWKRFVEEQVERLYLEGIIKI